MIQTLSEVTCPRFSSEFGACTLMRDDGGCSDESTGMWLCHLHGIGCPNGSWMRDMKTSVHWTWRVSLSQQQWLTNQLPAFGPLKPTSEDLDLSPLLNLSLLVSVVHTSCVSSCLLKSCRLSTSFRNLQGRMKL